MSTDRAFLAGLTVGAVIAMGATLTVVGWWGGC
jgi:hypothetical protein